MSKKEAYQKKMQAQLDEWTAEIDKLTAKAQKAQADAQLEYYKHIERLQAQQKEAHARLTEFQQASEDAWEDMCAGMESAWNSLGDAMKSATSRFK